MDTVCIDKRSGIPEKRNHVYDDGTLIFCWCMHWLRIRLYIWGIWCFYRICTTDCGTPVYVHWKDTGREWYTGRNGRRSKRSKRRKRNATETATRKTCRKKPLPTPATKGTANLSTEKKRTATPATKIKTAKETGTETETATVTAETGRTTANGRTAKTTVTDRVRTE